jgi:hypothetical protein
VCVFFLGDPLLLFLFFLVLFLCSGVACFESLKKNCSGFFLGLWVEELVCMLFPLIDALAISFPFLKQCYSLIFCEITVWLHHDLQSYYFCFNLQNGSLCVSLYVCMKNNLGALPEKQEVCPEWCHSFQADNVGVVVVVVVVVMIPPPPWPLEPTNHQKNIVVAQKDCGGGGRRWVDK